MSEEKEKKVRIVSELKYPLPDNRISLDSHFDIIKAYVVASNNGKTPAGYKELAPFIKIDSTLVSGCNKFFENIGIITKSEGGKYLPTENTIELFNALQWKNEELIKKTLQKILESTWFWIQTKQYLTVNESASREELIQKLGLGCGADPQKHTRALEKLIDYMKNSNLIKEDNGLFVINKNTISTPSHKEEHLQNKPEIVSNLQNSTNKTMTTPKQIDMTFGIIINPETSEEQIRKAVRTVVDELGKIQKEKRE